MRGCGGRLQCPQVSEDPGLLCVLPKRAGSSPAESAASRRVWEGVPSGPHLGVRQPGAGGGQLAEVHTILPSMEARTPASRSSLSRERDGICPKVPGWGF